MNKHPYLPLVLQYLIPVLYTALYYFFQIEPNDGSYWLVIMLLIGFYLGNLILWVDSKFLYGKYNELQTLPKQLITRSALFILAFVALSVFMVTSTGNLIGIGIILGIGTTLSLEMWKEKGSVELFHKQFLFQVKRQLTPIEIHRIVLGFSLFVDAMGLYFLLSAAN